MLNLMSILMLMLELMLMMLLTVMLMMVLKEKIMGELGDDVDDIQHGREGVAAGTRNAWLYCIHSWSHCHHRQMLMLSSLSAFYSV